MIFDGHATKASKADILLSVTHQSGGIALMISTCSFASRSAITGFSSKSTTERPLLELNMWANYVRSDCR